MHPSFLRWRPKRAPIPTWVAKSSLFKKNLELLNNACRLKDLLPEHALVEYKTLIREAARVSRNQLNDKYRYSKKFHLSNLVLASRLVSTNNLAQTKQLTMSTSFFKTRLHIRNGAVELIEPACFAEEFRVAKQQNLEYKIQREASAPPPGNKNSSKISAATRLAKLWRSTGPVNSIAAISSDRGVLTLEADKAQELGCIWARTFSKVGGVSLEASAFLDAQKTKWQFRSILPPGVGTFRDHILSLKDSATGPDGIPYSCYKALAWLSAHLFFGANLIALAGGIISVDFNIQRGCFIPKNSLIDGADPRADELRSLGLKKLR